MSMAAVTWHWVDRACALLLWTTATGLSGLSAGCGGFTAIQDAGLDARTDAEASLDADVEDSDVCDECAPSCLDGPPGLVSSMAGATDDFELPCSSGGPDIAFTWTASERGFYYFEAMYDSAGPRGLPLMLLDGDCGGEVLSCGGASAAGVFGYWTYTVIELDMGQTVTIVCEPTGLPVGEDIWTFGYLLPCPTQGVLEERATLRAQAVDYGAFQPILRNPSCFSSEDGQQWTLFFVAPMDGTYRFRADSWGEGSLEALSVWDENCHGEELACERGGVYGFDPIELSTDLVEGQTVVVGARVDPWVDGGDLVVELEVEQI